MPGTAFYQVLLAHQLWHYWNPLPCACCCTVLAQETLKNIPTAVGVRAYIGPKCVDGQQGAYVAF